MVAQSADDPVLRKLEELRARYEAISEEMNRPEVAGDRHRIVQLNKEHGKLRRIMEPYESYRQAQVEVEQSRAILDDPAADADFKALAEEELASALANAAQLMEALKAALVTGDDAAISSVILEIRAGTGGEEAALFAGNLRDMYQRYCDRQGFSVEVMDASASDLGGFKEVILNIKGEGVYQHLGYEGGGHRVQRVPITEAQGRIHTSAATVAVLPEPEDIDDRDRLGEGRRRARQPGRRAGRSERQQGLIGDPSRTPSDGHHRLDARREEPAQEPGQGPAHDDVAPVRPDDAAQRSQRDASRRSMIGSGDRSQRIRTYNFPQNRCTDHRIGLDLYCLDRIMDGELDELVAALQKHDLDQRLKNL
jgi:peptide chain release factor 1